MAKKLTGNSNIAVFFKKLELGEVFTYSEVFHAHEVIELGKNNGVDVIYCKPGSAEYRAHGRYTCIVVAKPKHKEHENWQEIDNTLVPEALTAIPNIGRSITHALYDKNFVSYRLSGMVIMSKSELVGLINIFNFVSIENEEGYIVLVFQNK